MAAYQVCFFSAVPRAGVAATALLAICSAPLMIAVLASLFLGEHLTGRVLLALVAGVTGTTLLVAGNSAHVGSSFLPGALLALGAGLSYATYAVITKAGLGSISPLSLAALTFSVAAAVLLPILVYERPAPSVFAAGWPLFLYLGAVPTALAYALYTTGLRRTTATAAGVAGLLEPLTATILGMVVFHESLSPAGILGGILLLSALALLALPASPIVIMETDNGTAPGKGRAVHTHSRNSKS
jgi:DME family drug/metabolite transporter